jgi:pSer/pThr/pTyr-binding forkhead associated (FHA) protein
MNSLYFQNGPRAGEEFKIEPPSVTIGRETDNTLNILTAGVSRYHAKLEFMDGAWMVSDRGSTNGTKVNGQPVPAPRPLSDGDIIGVGEQNLIFHFKDETRIPTAVNINADQTAKLQTGAKPVVKPVEKRFPGPFAEGPEPPPAPAADDAEAVSFNFPKPEPAQNEATGVSFNFPPQRPAEPPPPPPGKDAPAPQEPPAAAKEKHSTVSVGESQKSGGSGISFDKINIFGRDTGKEKSAADGHKAGGKKHAGLLFYTAIVGAAVIFVAVFIMMEKQSPKPPPPQLGAAAKKSPLLLVYEKQFIDRDNVFYFSLKLENNTAVFTLDDLKSKRHYSKTVPEVGAAFADRLESRIKETSFMSLQSEPPGASTDGTDKTRSILVGMGDSLNKVVVRNNFARSSFEEIEAAADEFAEQYGLRTISLTPEEMKAEAANAYAKAEELFLNYEAKPENLRECIERYKLAIEMLEQFSPKPEQWSSAMKRQNEAQNILDKKIKDLTFDLERFMKLKDFLRARDACAKLMDMLAPDSKAYEQVRVYKLALDKQLSQPGGKK